MFNFLVTAEGGLTTAGYVVAVIAVLILIILIAVLLQKNTSALKFTTQQLVTCAVALALAYVTSYIKIFKLPFGGSVTLFSMLFIVLIGYWYGIKVGILTGLVYGIFQFLQEPYVLSFFQVCCDYILAFGAMGLSGLFTKSRKHGRLKAYIIAILARGAFHARCGYLDWKDYLPENFKIHQMRAEYKQQARLNDVICPARAVDENKTTVLLNDQKGEPYAVVEFK